MWTCNHCAEECDDQFDACWNCSKPRGSHREPAVAVDPKAAMPRRTNSETADGAGSKGPSVSPEENNALRQARVDVSLAGVNATRSCKVMPFIGRIGTGFFSVDNAGTVAQQLALAIEREATDGWMFHSLAKVDVEVRPGCIAGLFGARTSYVTFDQLVFFREP